jgi:hypothetical protein
MRSLVLVLVLGLAMPVLGQPPEAPVEVNPGLTQLRLQLNPEFPNWSPEYVVERCAEHLATLNESERINIRYFDMSDVPRAVLPAAVSSLLFGCNSASTAPITTPPQPVPHTDNRIFWIDLGWYRWAPEVWENISLEDPYFREPLIASTATGWNYLRDQTKANAVIRGSWFMYYTYDTTQFLGRGATQADQAFYYQLIYGLTEREIEIDAQVTVNVKKQQTVQVRDRYNRLINQVQEVDVPQVQVQKVKKLITVANAPQTAKEFEQFWKVDFELLKDWPIDQGAIVDEGRSAVAYQNRVLWRIRTAMGVYYRTFDVFRSVGDQDFVEGLFPKIYDAGEHIVQDAKGAQFYLLTDGAGKRVEFADPRLVHDSVSGNRVLLTAASCIHCHDVGILPVRNEAVILRDNGVELKANTFERAERIKQFFLGNLQRLVEIDQNEYTEFIRTCNGLTPTENTAQFSRFRSWYFQPVTLIQAAREIGCEPLELADALATGTKGRLGRLALDGTPIPRPIWERGGYQEAFLLLLEKRKAATIVPVSK